MTEPSIAARLFVLQRDRDITGVSGPGPVADGVQWADGTVVLRWRERPSTSVWESLDLMLSVHGHDGATRVVWADEEARARHEFTASILEAYDVPASILGPDAERAYLHRQLAGALLNAWEARGTVVDHPESHCATFADAVMPVVDQVLEQRDRAQRAAGRAYQLADRWEAAHGASMLLVRAAGAELRDVLDDPALDDTTAAKAVHLVKVDGVLAEGDADAAREALRQMEADPHDLKAGMVVRPYTERGEQKWVFRCWGTDDGCDGFLSLDHFSEQSAQRARDRHIAEDHPDEEHTPDTDMTEVDIDHAMGTGTPVQVMEHPATREAPAADEDALRATRRNSLLNLLDRLDRTRTLTPEERTLLRRHVEAEIREGDHARQQAASVRALHQPVEGLGFDSDEDDTPGSYGHISQVCASCGKADEYGVRWPCPTIRALAAPAPVPSQAAIEATEPETQCRLPHEMEA